MEHLIIINLADELPETLRLYPPVPSILGTLIFSNCHDPFALYSIILIDSWIADYNKDLMLQIVSVSENRALRWTTFCGSVKCSNIYLSMKLPKMEITK
jgi:hypothetical protein